MAQLAAERVQAEEAKRREAARQAAAEEASGWSGNVAGRSASRPTGWRSSDEKPNDVRRSGSGPNDWN